MNTPELINEAGRFRPRPKLLPRILFKACFAMIVIAAPFLGRAQKFDTSATGTVNGQYYVREVLLNPNSSGVITVAQSLTGIMTFNAGGGYLFSGQEMDTTTGSPQAYTKSGLYAVSSSGLFVVQDPLIAASCSSDPTACDWGGVGAFGPNAIVANASSGSSNRIFIAIPIGVNVSAVSFNG